MNTTPKRLLQVLLLAACSGFLLTEKLLAQPFTLLHTFNGADGNQSGKTMPWRAGLTASNNTVYGTTGFGGNTLGSGPNGWGYGTVFAFRGDTKVFATLHNFNGTNEGAFPSGDLILAGTTLYGTTFSGGDSQNGTVFVINTDGTGFRTLYSFTVSSDGSGPTGLVLFGNTLYGTTGWGGASSAGTIFKINIDGTGFRVLYTFSGGSDGSSPQGLILSDNVLYGAATGQFGTGAGPGDGRNGTLFALNTDGTGFRIIYSFSATSGSWPPYNSDGACPASPLLLSGNTLYGAAFYGGDSGRGTIFQVNTDGTGFSPLYSFSAYYNNGQGLMINTDGAGAQSGLVLLGNTLYGVATGGGSGGYGTVFGINTDGTGFEVLHTFTTINANTDANNDGAYPIGLILSDSTLFGTASLGGVSGLGTIFNIPLSVPRPELAISQSAGKAIFSWPTTFTGFSLQSASNLSPGATWVDSTITPVIVADRYVVTNSFFTNAQFYRLMK